MEEDRLHKIALGLVPGVGAVLTKQLVSYCGSAKAVFSSSYQKLIKIPGIGPSLANNILKSDALLKAETELTLAEKQNVRLLYYTDKEYPQRLKQVNDSPPLLYFKGNTNLNSNKIVGIVGTRQATEYGKSVTEELVKGLAKHQCLIVSGLAYGIDIAAHKAALKYDLPTVGVMASGIDIIYPAIHKQTAQQMLSTGGLLTENPFGSKPDAPQFPARNRIIAAMADALIVVEATSKGGALITADIANSYNKDVFAVPGNLGQRHSEGCNNLIRDHKAGIITCLEDLEKQMNWDMVQPGKQLSLNVFDELNFTKEENQIIGLLKSNHEIMIDDLAWKTGITTSQLPSILLQLEFQGIIKALPGKKFALAKK
jgi:DNA processing protein